MLDVVFEEDDRDRPREWQVRGSEQEVGNAQIEVARREQARRLLAEGRESALPEIDGERREPRACERDGKTGGAAFRRGVWK
jgi:hypothetical protein